MAKTLTFRGREFARYGQALAGAVVDIYDSDSLDPIGKGVTNARGIWLVEIRDEFRSMHHNNLWVPPFYRVLHHGMADVVAERVEPVDWTGKYPTA